MLITRTEIHPLCILRTPSDIVFNALFNYGSHPKRPPQKTLVFMIWFPGCERPLVIVIVIWQDHAFCGHRILMMLRDLSGTFAGPIRILEDVGRMLGRLEFKGPGISEAIPCILYLHNAHTAHNGHNAKAVRGFSLAPLYDWHTFPRMRGSIVCLGVY